MWFRSIPLVRVALGLLAGIFLAHNWAPSAVLLVGACVLGLVGGPVAAALSDGGRRAGPHLASWLMYSLALISSGAALYTFDARVWPDDDLRSVAPTDRSGVLVGVIAAEPVVRYVRADSLAEQDGSGALPPVPGLRPTGLRLAVRVERWTPDGGPAQTVSGGVLVRLRFRDPESRAALSQLALGERVQLTGHLRPLDGARNPGSFDGRAYYGRRDLTHAFSPASTGGVERLGPARLTGWLWMMKHVVVPARAAVRRAIRRAMPADEARACLVGLLLGDRSEMDPEIVQNFARSGTIHVLAVSGLHVALLAAVVFVPLVRLRARPRVVATLVVLWSYGALTGFAPSIARAVIMATIVLIGRLLERPPTGLNTLAASAVVLLLIDARQPFDLGFQLSFCAVAGLLILAPEIARWTARWPGRRWAGWLYDALGLSVAAQLATLPVVVATFGRVPLAASLANLVVVPLAGVATVSGVLMVLTGWWTGLSALFGASAWAALEAMFGLVAGANRLPLAATEWTGPDAALGAVVLVAMLVVLTQLDRPRRALRALTVAAGLAALALVRPLLVGESARPLRVTFIDVGQGDAALVELPDGRALLVDAGPWTPTFDAGEALVRPYLRVRGADHLTAVVLSHPHLDHIGGLQAILRATAVERVLDSGQTPPTEAVAGYVQLAGGRRHTLVRGDTVALGNDVRLYVLGPEPGQPPLPDSRQNNVSVAVKLVYGATSVLFLGDAESGEEAELVARYGDFLRADVVKMAHHGSRTSSTAELIAATGASDAVASVGRLNRYGHPNAEVIARWRRAGTRVHLTETAGAIVFESDGRRFREIAW